MPRETESSGRCPRGSARTLSRRCLVLLAGAALVGLALPGSAPAQPGAPEAHEQAPPAQGLVYVTLETSAGDIVLELDAERAPISVENFLGYVDRGAYDGTIFHRVIPTFVVQGGGYEPDLRDRAKQEGGGENRDPRIKNEWTNGLKNVRGSVAMARETDPDTATREFYINVADNPRLDTARETTGGAGYAVFGRVARGMDVVDRIKDAPTHDRPDLDMQNVPVEPVVVRRARRSTPEEAGAPDEAPGE